MWYVEYGEEGEWHESDWFDIEAEAKDEADRLDRRGVDEAHVVQSDPFEEYDPRTSFAQF